MMILPNIDDDVKLKHCYNNEVTYMYGMDKFAIVMKDSSLVTTIDSNLLHTFMYTDIISYNNKFIQNKVIFCT